MLIILILWCHLHGQQQLNSRARNVSKARHMISTKRLNLCKLADRHREAFAVMHADAEVMEDLGGPIDHRGGAEKFDRYLAALSEQKVSRWAVENKVSEFLGYCGVMPRLDSDHPLGPHFEIGWRFRRAAWGHGYATEAAQASLEHAVTRLGLTSIVSYTERTNRRSQSVMGKLGLLRDSSQDFTLHEGARQWHLLVWTVPVPLPLVGR